MARLINWQGLGLELLTMGITLGRGGQGEQLLTGADSVAQLIDIATLDKFSHQLNYLRWLRIGSACAMQLAEQHIEYAQCVLCHVQRFEHIIQYAPIAYEQ